jgi:hypothetical protein
MMNDKTYIIGTEYELCSDHTMTEHTQRQQLPTKNANEAQ